MLKKKYLYTFQFFGKNRWRILVTKEIRLAIASLFSLLGIVYGRENASFESTLVVTAKEELNSKILVAQLNDELSLSLPQSGWKQESCGKALFWFHRNSPCAICSAAQILKQINNPIALRVVLFPIYRQVIQVSAAVPFHAALMEYNKQGFLFVGKTRSGKSTCCERIPLPWNPLCDDDALVMMKREKEYVACPVPISNVYPGNKSKKRGFQRKVPLAAIYFIEQADRDKAEKTGKGKAALLINESAKQTWFGSYIKNGGEKNLEIRNKLFENSCLLASTVPTFRLFCSLNGKFWEKVEASWP